MVAKRRTWVIWVVAGAVVLVLGVVGAGLLLAPTLFPAGSPAASPSAAPSTEPAVSPTPSATPRPTASGTPAATPAPTPSIVPTSAPTPVPTPTTAPPSDPPSPGVGTVTPFIVSAEWDGASLSVSATVPGVVESGGTCTIVATLGAASVSDSFAASPSAESTDCGTNALESPDFAAGEWSVVVRYSSAESSGQSSPLTVVIT